MNIEANEGAEDYENQRDGGKSPYYYLKVHLSAGLKLIGRREERTRRDVGVRAPNSFTSISFRIS